ncbi:MAG: secondary thiamine-phosphate synthase enzyme YjbQ [Candidatus Pacebacteria bacterium]|nr:secondary thiamine-phosphate synthase enzyme YjbQ [Candidatus Paceibacterota bacterium]MDR3583660.1 secondary thiamine-phosphate synthase enzyme YjbQ [Candidatus Paceibacterota bacterium]
MKIRNHVMKLTTNATLDFIDITDKVLKMIKEKGVKNGVINIQSMHTTMAVIIQEAEPLLLGDLKKTLEKVAPRTTKYMHDNFSIRTVNMNPNEPINGHSHCKALFLTPGVFLNIAKSKLQLGKWQRIFAVELDDARPRMIALQIIGN